MKFPFFSLLFSVAIFGSASLLPAQTLTVDLQTASGQGSGVFENASYQGNPFTFPAVPFEVTITEVDGVSVTNPTTWIAFCIELIQGGNSGVVQEFQAAPLVSALLPDAGLRAARLAWIMDNFAPSAEPTGWPYSQALPLSVAMQLAVWELVSDDDLTLSGVGLGFNVGAQTDPTLANAAALTESWLGSLSAAGVDESYVSKNYIIGALTNPDNQDLLYLRTIPEPSSMWFLAFGTLALLRRRR